MAEFQKRPEITVSSMGHVHNPTGSGVPASSQFAQAKAQKVAQKASSTLSTSPPTSSPRPRSNSSTSDSNKPSDGTSRRNITRKNSSFSHSTSHKKQGGHGKASWSLKSKVREETIQKSNLDPKDPNYDSEDESHGGYVLTSESGVSGSPPRHSYDPSFRKMVIGPSLTLAEFKIRIDTGLSEVRGERGG
ncbi:hypothetical protein TrLO_g7854 [Triparma laevis f. longispina]|uniref:Uncharacterized protein n=1 Tax=Triparma laevis f. longispina TaxID=1714387 RepID=A0A9W7E054_9STRA|nr:hypothetical protein TrLO_g7854 [Triparma laevis f. longispina]